jgi:antitoxin HicB
MRKPDYAVVIEALADEDGGGFVATVPDLLGCMSDGGTREEAARNVEDAIASWLEEARAVGRVIPEPRAALRIA